MKNLIRISLVSLIVMAGIQTAGLAQTATPHKGPVDKSETKTDAKARESKATKTERINAHHEKAARKKAAKAVKKEAKSVDKDQAKPKVEGKKKEE